MAEGGARRGCATGVILQRRRSHSWAVDGMAKGWVVSYEEEGGKKVAVIRSLCLGLGHEEESGGYLGSGGT